MTIRAVIELECPSDGGSDANAYRINIDETVGSDAFGPSEGSVVVSLVYCNNGVAHGDLNLVYCGFRYVVDSLQPELG